ncbi:DNA (cytosine-5-)-methyltransferase [Flexivirga meconopsidis]|uniref:DNA (cytosine-5-)-methyltransferase n=1 Tax=Flexivirga meconopsidis TaxID=2977121 RepID=UPI00223EE758|nr:DNA (cytosine-5-)-methyltransferase [Flexivirga meconopsidis]
MGSTRAQQAKRFKFVDLFAGLGGFHVALDDLDGEGVFAVEWEPTLNALYTKNFNMAAWSDINDLASDEIIRAQVPDHQVLTAGFPCQPFSKAGDQLGFKDTAQGHLFYKVHDILRVKQPRRFILENVPNILEHDGRKTVAAIKRMLEEIGYSVDVRRYSPHEFGIPQIRDRAYFVGSLDGLDDFKWPKKHKDPTDITSVLRQDVIDPRPIPEGTLHAINMWGDFLRRSPTDLKLPSFPIWAMEFGATYPYEDETPSGVWKRRSSRGFSGMHVLGSFGFTLDGMTIPDQKDLIPSHARREDDFVFPRWKRTFIRQNRDFYHDNAEWIDPWLEQWQPWDLNSSFQKLEWNAQGEERDIDNFVLQVRASGIRIKRPTTAPSLIAFTQTQVPILGANLAGRRRYITPRECAQLQSLQDLDLPENDHDAYKALGNAVNARVVHAIAEELTKGLDVSMGRRIRTVKTRNADNDTLGAIA